MTWRALHLTCIKLSLSSLLFCPPRLFLDQQALFQWMNSSLSCTSQFPSQRITKACLFPLLNVCVYTYIHMYMCVYIYIFFLALSDTSSRNSALIPLVFPEMYSHGTAFYYTTFHTLLLFFRYLSPWTDYKFNVAETTVSLFTVASLAHSSWVNGIAK